jgi:hypothetical protein
MPPGLGPQSRAGRACTNFLISRTFSENASDGDRQSSSARASYKWLHGRAVGTFPPAVDGLNSPFAAPLSQFGFFWTSLRTYLQNPIDDAWEFSSAATLM